MRADIVPLAWHTAHHIFCRAVRTAAAAGGIVKNYHRGFPVQHGLRSPRASHLFKWEKHGCSLELHTERAGEGQYHERITTRLHTAAGAFDISGTVLAMLPLRNRRDGKVTRIAEGLIYGSKLRLRNVRRSASRLERARVQPGRFDVRVSARRPIARVLASPP